MKNILIKALDVQNFKCFQAKHFDFAEGINSICGDNGLGKTTIFDAITWCLFGKDSQGRADTNFSIVPINSEGETQHHLETKVDLMLIVDSKETTLTRAYNEVWSKPRGQQEEVLTGHTTTFYLNGIRLETKSAYTDVVNNILDESTFKLLTNPYHFFSLTAEEQKKVITTISGGEVSADVVAKNRQDFQDLLKEIEGVSIATFLKSVASRKNVIKKDIDIIPEKIKTADALRVENQDWDALDKEVEGYKKQISEIESSLSAEEEQLKEDNDARLMLLQRKYNIERVIQNRRNQLRDNNGTNSLLTQIQSLQVEIDSKEGLKATMENALKLMTAQRDEHLATLDKMRGEYRNILAEELQFGENDFRCPTCGREYDEDMAEEIRKQMVENFNADKSKRLNANKTKGIALKKEVEGLLKNIADKEHSYTDLKKELNDMRDNLASLKDKVASAPSSDDIIKNDDVLKDMQNCLGEILANLAEVGNTKVNVSLREEKQILLDKISATTKVLAGKDNNERIDAEIEKLRATQSKLYNELTKLEGQECTAIELQKAMDEELLTRINKNFSLIKWTFLKNQLNGGEKLVCVATIDGKPYADANAASKLNAGIDVINAIANSTQSYAPIVVDNAEGVNNLLPTKSQVIRLVVTTDKSLIIK